MIVCIQLGSGRHPGGSSHRGHGDARVGGLENGKETGHCEEAAHR